MAEIEVVSSIVSLFRDNRKQQGQTLLNNYSQMQRDRWISRGSLDIRPLIHFWIDHPQHSEANRLVECLMQLSALRTSMSQGLEDANTERIFAMIMRQIFRPRSVTAPTLKFDRVLDFIEDLATPVVIEKYSSSYGVAANLNAQQFVFQQRNSVDVTADELYIAPIAEQLKNGSAFAKKQGVPCIIPITFGNPSAGPVEAWKMMHLPIRDKSLREFRVLLTKNVSSMGSDLSWAFQG